MRDVLRNLAPRDQGRSEIKTQRPYQPVKVLDQKLWALPAAPDLFDITQSSVEIQAVVQTNRVSVSNVEIIREVGRGMILTFQILFILLMD